MGQIDDFWRYDGRRAVVTGCASGIGEHVARQLIELGAEVVGLDRRRPVLQLKEFHDVDLADPVSIRQAASAIGGQVDSLFNVAGVSSGIGDPLLVVTINFLGMRQFTEALIATMPNGSSIVSVSSLAASGYLQHWHVTAGLVEHHKLRRGHRLVSSSPRCTRRRWLPAVEGGDHPVLHEEAVRLGARGVRINCTGPGVTETPILDQLRSAYGQDYLDTIPKPLGRVAQPSEQAAVLVFLNSLAASYITGQVLWVDGGISAARSPELRGDETWPA